jgi:hypothetical protein
MAAYIESLTTNWFTVADISQLHTLVGLIECDPRQGSGEELKVHERDGRVRLTMVDCIDTRLDYWDEEEEEDIDFVESIVGLLAEGAVLRVTSVSWYKGEVARFMYDVYTSDGRSYRMNTMSAESNAAKELGVSESVLQSY